MDSCLVQIPSELITDDFRMLGHGIGFGSLELPQADHITFSAANKLPVKLRAEVLLFDYWIQNTDRTLGAAGGNPNLLTSSERPLAIIDHGNAFELDFDLVSFINHHAFANTRSEWLDPSKCMKWGDRAREALAMIESRWKSIPQEWQETVLGELQQEIALEKVRFLLNRSTSNTSLFWSSLISS